MHEAALAWAASVLGADLASAVELFGGLTSTMLALTDVSGRQSVLRLMTTEPWRTHGSGLTRRESAAQHQLQSTPVPAPVSLALDADGARTGEAAHLMSRLPGRPTTDVDPTVIAAMADMLATVHAVHPQEPFRTYQSWAWEAKHVVPPWTKHPASWTWAFDILSGEPPEYDPTFIHRDYSHRNLLWTDGAVSGVVDWVETSTGPAWLDAAHAATNLALAFGPEPARAFLTAYADRTPTSCDTYWLIMDAVGFLPPPGKEPLFKSATELSRLDQWLHDLITQQM